MSHTDRGTKVTVGCPGCGRLNRVDIARAADRPRCGQCRDPIRLDRPVPLSDASFDRVVADAQVPLVVDFYADWCGPCKMMEPVLDTLAQDRRGQILVAKLDTDRNSAAAARYEVRALPTLIVFRGGQPFAREVGAIARSRLDALVDAALR